MAIGSNIGPSEQIGEQGFYWWLGSIVNIGSDPDEFNIGLAQVRIPNLHDAMADSDLPWAQVIMPVTSPSVQGVGDTPALKVGSMVFGFFGDSAGSVNLSRVLFIVGTIPHYPGFSSGNQADHSLSLDARGTRTIDKEAKKLPLEPTDPYQAEYPLNRVIKTEAGHMIELDDTPGHERVHLYHKSGSYVEIQPDGTVVIKSVKDSVEVAEGTKNVYIKGDAVVDVEGNLTATVKKDVKFVGKGNIDIAAAGRLTLKALTGITLDSGTDVVAAAPGGFSSTIGAIRSATSLIAGSAVTADVIVANGKSYVFKHGILTQSST